MITATTKRKFGDLTNTSQNLDAISQRRHGFAAKLTDYELFIFHW